MNNPSEAARRRDGAWLIKAHFATREEAELAVCIVDLLFHHFYLIALSAAIERGERPAYLDVSWPYEIFHRDDLDTLRSLLAALE